MTVFLLIDTSLLDILTCMDSKATLVILLEEDGDYKLLKAIINEHPELETGFTLNDLLNIRSISWNDKIKLRNVFSNYSKVFSPDIHFTLQGKKWLVEQIRPQPHQPAMKILNLIQKSGEYSIGTNISTADLKLIEMLINKLNDISRRECADNDFAYKIDQEMLQFISNRLKQTLGETAPFNYKLVLAFLDCLAPYDEMMIKREFGG